LEPEQVELEELEFTAGRSVGDALIVVALLLFAAGWPLMWLWDGIDFGEEELDGWTALLVITVVFGPSLWAASLVHRIVDA
jgi:hypothetical protein